MAGRGVLIKSHTIDHVFFSSGVVLSRYEMIIKSAPPGDGARTNFAVLWLSKGGAVGQISDGSEIRAWYNSGESGQID